MFSIIDSKNNTKMLLKHLAYEVFQRNCTLVQKSYCYTPSVRIYVSMQNVRANVKVLEFRSFCILSCILTLFIILIKPLTIKAYGSHTASDCGISCSTITKLMGPCARNSQKVPEVKSFNFFFSPPAHLCAITCMTETSSTVTQNNKSTKPIAWKHLSLC